MIFHLVDSEHLTTITIEAQVIDQFLVIIDTPHG